MKSACPALSARAALAMLAALAALAGCAAPLSGRVVTMQAEVDIARPLAEVYRFASEPQNDPGWRLEGGELLTDGALALGATYVETQDIGLYNGYRMRVQVTALEPGALVRVEAPAEDGRVFLAERQFRPGPTGTRLRYLVWAEDRVVREITVLPVPLWLAKVVYEAEMASTLRALRDRMERR